MKKKWLSGLWAVLLVLALGLSGCSQSSSGTGGQKELVVAFDSDVPTMDPHMHNEPNAITTNWHIFDSLLFLSRDLKIEPGLAESYEQKDDTTWIFKLRQGVTFHNGEEFNADAVKFSLERVLNEKQKSPQRGNISAISAVNVLDPYTVEIKTKEPYNLLPHRLFYLSIVPPKYVQEVGDQEFAQKPVGTGPYKFAEWVKGDKIVLEANENYFKGAPKIKKVSFRVIPEVATQIAELQSGGVDIIRMVPPDMLAQLEGNPQLAVTSTPLLRVYYMAFDTKKKPFDDARVRQAMNYAVDIDTIVKKVLADKAVRTPAGVNPNHFGFDESIKPYPYDPEKAKSLLKEAGYENGFETEIHYFTPGIGQQITDAVISDLSKVGIKAKAKFYPESSSFVEKQRAGDLPFRLGHWGSYSVYDADAILQPMFDSKGVYGKYFNTPQLDALINEARSSVDQDKRKALYSQAQQLIYKEAPWIFLFSPMDNQAYNAKLQFQARADERIYAYEIDFKE
ncbi:ABC transporter substrate-binding protein [Brevibacillus borstelensis]|jgi:peptide/nickel transport system substrate-binding protein|uniref:ABC transporter substrate-binding protein n=1 Tax=Brevibacillus TaxID=55080 RepID=UPI00068AF14A|nr:ABC transporter substrate-binding protein [Brevibacillus borstelensis]MCM3591827.1 ABC transporter substrate-binding protein [Brevibacillus borstelensis]MED1744894.1 ABC transporter substrate-binding protein [Brevibacillus borstelensis]MED1882249.1 ABC transporter substrate-binding protein [Brevibacillus borstelensis]RNB64743.1 ABC transporter substrate-binding protein [Brevibacillus borstelensis]WNF07127.1 ABC transporter substrate-binding protein [Brevibacillus borstelensis]